MIAALALAPILLACAAETKYEADVRFALAEIEEQCGDLIAQKRIDWKAVGKEMTAAAKKVGSDAEHLQLLVRLLARLHDGHASVEPREATKSVQPPDAVDRVPPGFGLCRSGKKILVRSAFGAAKDAGLESGMEVVSVDGVAAAAWLDQRVATLSDTVSFSTPQHAFFCACEAGLAEPPGTRHEFALKDVKGKATKRALIWKKHDVARGPAHLPQELASTDDVAYGRTAKGNGYLWIRRCKESLPAQVDQALAALGDVKGVILDFRGNTGGSFDHEALMGRFLPPGATLPSDVKYATAGDHPFGGDVVVIVDGAVVSAGETAAGMFKEDGRAYMIGESATAGMSSQKVTIELPSGLFGLYVSVRSNKQRFNDGKGIEGIGVVPHRVIELQQKDLAAGVDTLIREAEAILAAFPRDVVGFRTKD